MPLIAWSALAYAAGLLVGFAVMERYAVLAAVALAGLASGASRARHAWLGAVVAIAAGGVLVAVAEGAQERSCAARLAVRRTWTLRVERVAVEGDVARGQLSADGCVRRATVFVASGHGAPGELLELSGRAAVEERSVLVQDGRLRTFGADGVLS